MEEPTFDEALRLLETAGLAEEMFPFVEMQPLPAGAGIAEIIKVADPEARHVGSDAAGGADFRRSDGAIVLASSEGQAARLGPDCGLRTALAAGVALGGLHDALRFVGRDLDGDRAAWLAARAS